MGEAKGTGPIQPARTKPSQRRVPWIQVNARNTLHGPEVGWKSYGSLSLDKPIPLGALVGDLNLEFPAVTLWVYKAGRWRRCAYGIFRA